MARLSRVYQKVFASNASNNGVFGSLQAGNPQTSNDVATLQSLSAFENGWDDAIEQGDKLPPLEEFQGIQYGISYQQAYMLQEGIPEWEANTPYYKGSLAKIISGTSFKLYCSLADNNTGNVVTNTTYWKLIMDSDDLYALDSTVVHNTGDETIAGTKTFSSTISGSIDGNAATATKATGDGNGDTISSTYAKLAADNTFSGNNTLSGANKFTGSVEINSSGAGIELVPSSSTTVGGIIDFHFAGSSANYTSRIIEDASGQLSIKGDRLMVPDSTTAGSAIATKAISKGANGYLKLSNGVIIQWGRFSTEDPTITFPTAFSNTNYSVCCTENRDTTNADACCWDSKTTTTVKLYTQRTSGNWIAIGY
jgi:hypothetical protein